LSLAAEQSLSKSKLHLGNILPWEASLKRAQGRVDPELTPSGHVGDTGEFLVCVLPGPATPFTRCSIISSGHNVTVSLHSGKQEKKTNNKTIAESGKQSIKIESI